MHPAWRLHGLCGSGARREVRMAAPKKATTKKPVARKAVAKKVVAKTPQRRKAAPRKPAVRKVPDKLCGHLCNGKGTTGDHPKKPCELKGPGGRHGGMHFHSGRTYQHVYRTY